MSAERDTAPRDPFPLDPARMRRDLGRLRAGTAAFWSWQRLSEARGDAAVRRLAATAAGPGAEPVPPPAGAGELRV